ncbi:MAG: hypothetical protein EAZ95_14440 [Bacteroidetes bacterium]|nr:MAG: hypothetical protein EAZ95_14440 [Bacteroidota bacterium]
MRPFVFIFCLYLGVVGALAQTNEKPYLRLRKENSVTIPVEVPKGKVTFVYNDRVGYVREGKTPKQIIITPYHTENFKVAVLLEGKQIWEKEYEVKRSTDKQILFVHEKSTICLPTTIPPNAQVTVETDNGTFYTYRSHRGVIQPNKVGKCLMTAKINGQKVWEEELEVRKETPPEFFLANAAGKKLDLRLPLPAHLSYRAVLAPDSLLMENTEGFGYRMYGVYYSLWRGNKAIQSGQSADGSIPSPKSMGAIAGDKMMVQIMGAQKVYSTCPILNIKVPDEPFVFTVR